MIAVTNNKAMHQGQGAGLNGDEAKDSWQK
jgi:hypothetical protein